MNLLELDLAVEAHDLQQTTAPSVDTVVQTKTGLADLNISDFVGSLAVGVEQGVRLDACEPSLVFTARSESLPSILQDGNIAGSSAS